MDCRCTEAKHAGRGLTISPTDYRCTEAEQEDRGLAISPADCRCAYYSAGSVGVPSSLVILGDSPEGGKEDLHQNQMTSSLPDLFLECTGFQVPFKAVPVNVAQSCSSYPEWH